MHTLEKTIAWAITIDGAIVPYFTDGKALHQHLGLELSYVKELFLRAAECSSSLILYSKVILDIELYKK